MKELHDNGRMWATVEHSGDICKIVVYNNTGNTAWVIPRHALQDLIEALKK
jgi:hypothetical protein